MHTVSKSLSVDDKINVILKRWKEGFLKQNWLFSRVMMTNS